MTGKHRRIANWWIRWEDLNWPDHDNAEKIVRRADAMAEADVTTALIFGAHFRWDYLPYFEILHDYIAAVAEACHERGMELIDHHSVNLVHRYSTREEMRRVILHSGPHLPFSPSREAAESWEWHGERLNDWRMIDTETRKVLYMPQYTAEGFCYRNPRFVAAYIDYAKKLVKDTGIDGLMADDTVYFMNYRACACEHCRAELRRRAGIDLPPAGDTEFWGNYDSGAWRAWVDLRKEACGDFRAALKAALPDTLLMACGSHYAEGACNNKGTDARQCMRGDDMLNIELCGNTPPYRHDPVTVNIPIMSSVTCHSLHEAAVREKQGRCYVTGYGFSPDSVRTIWALSKMVDADCYFATLKERLGLPRHILNTLPDEAELVKDVFRFEKEHEALFDGERRMDAAVYFSQETRDHSLFGNRGSGFSLDYRAAVGLLYKNGISARTVFDIPKDGKTCPLLLIPSALLVTEAEKAALKAYLAAGGKVLAMGPCGFDGCESRWKIANRLNEPTEKFYITIRDGVWVKMPPWVSEAIPKDETEGTWREVCSGFLYHPLRVSDPAGQDALLAKCRELTCPSVAVREQTGYIVSVFERGKDTLLHFFATEYDVKIDEELDRIRYHRSRMNLVTEAKPVGTEGSVALSAPCEPEVFLPFGGESARTEKTGENEYRVHVPKDCAYFIVRIAGT